MFTTIRKNIVFLFIAVPCTISCVSTNDLPKGFSMQVTKYNFTPRHYKTILMEGFGTSASRLFFDHLYEPLALELYKADIILEKKFEVNGAAVFAGSDNKSTPYMSQDAVLIIAPKPAAGVREKNIPDPAHTNQIEQNYQLTLFDKPTADSPIWALILNIAIDFTQEKPYQVLAKKIIEDMKRNRLVQ